MSSTVSQVAAWFFLAGLFISHGVLDFLWVEGGGGGGFGSLWRMGSPLILHSPQPSLASCVPEQLGHHPVRPWPKQRVVATCVPQLLKGPEGKAGQP